MRARRTPERRGASAMQELGEEVECASQENA